jgi:hypothetical protein
VEWGMIIVTSMKRRIRLFFFVLIVGSVYPMDLAFVKTKKNKSSFFISRKKGTFDSLSLNDISCWYDRLSVDKKQLLYKHCNKQTPSRRALFNFITMDSDIQRVVLAHMFHGNEKAVDIFCQKPLCNAFERRMWSQRLPLLKNFNQVKNFIESRSQKKIFDTEARDLLFQLSQKVVLLNQALKVGFKKKVVYDRPVLEAFHAIVEQFNLPVSKRLRLRYRFFEPMTMDNFKKHCSKEQLYSLPSYVVPCFLKLIGEGLNAEYAKFSIYVATYQIGLYVKTARYEGLRWDDIVSAFTMLSIPAWLSSRIWEQVVFYATKGAGYPFVGASSVAVLYFLSCCASIFYEIEKVHDGQVSFEQLPDLLKRTDIVIV